MRRMLCGLLLLTMLAAPALADTGRERGQSRGSNATSNATRTRVIWTVIGAGAGFAAGVYLGFAKFDDATYAERKIWTSAIVGAAAGGVGGALLSRKTGRSVPMTDVSNAAVVRPWSSDDVSWSEAVRGPSPTTVFKR
jgi:hypothetical protein